MSTDYQEQLRKKFETVACGYYLIEADKAKTICFHSASEMLRRNEDGSYWWPEIADGWEMFQSAAVSMESSQHLEIQMQLNDAHGLNIKQHDQIMKLIVEMNSMIDLSALTGEAMRGAKLLPHIVNSLRQTGLYHDEEGEDAKALEALFSILEHLTHPKELTNVTA